MTYRIDDRHKPLIIGYIFISMILLSFLLTSCESSPVSLHPEYPISPSQPADQSELAKNDRPIQDIVVWSLGGNGWAIQLGSRLLVFDYVEVADPQASPPDLRSLITGYINPSEMNIDELLVFVTHSHPDHFDPIIFDWQDEIDNISYFFGWQADDNPDYHYLVGPRAVFETEDMHIFTINSHHAGVPEVAFLIKIDGLTVYFNGDYMSAYEEDFEYLHTITNRIDIAFVIGWPYPDHQQFQQAILLEKLFQPEFIFASCRQGDQEKCHDYSDLLHENEVEAIIRYSEKRGQSFTIPH